ncbi:uncharacterized protein LOC143607605 [Bidens hawaiensis]|uniref:uncharacterized protein LOC143607605 n=1 Tax=Bidens hawaiensis TaxID=980011 RepID=UPI00404A79FF
MEMEYGKLFIGGISWDTNEESLKDYFQTFGEVIEAIIMKDRTTGRARGFGFVVFSDPAVAERVVKEKHVIDGRAVEAKKAVPRDDHQVINRSSPGPIRTKKIFVGGLASSVTETEFKNYFNQYGMITDVVVMYDHNTNRPRGFGFITYESEESVDKALMQTFHELNGKMVEVKRAVPKEGSSGSVKSPMSGISYGLSRGGSLFDYGLSPGYNSPRFSPGYVGRSGYDMGLNFDLGLGVKYGGNGSYRSDIGHKRAINQTYSVGLNRFADPFGYGLGGVGGGGKGFVLKPTNYDMWASGRHNLSNIWSGSSGGQGGGVGVGNGSYIGGNLDYGNEESNVGYKRSNGFSGSGGFSSGGVGGGSGGIGGGNGSFIGSNLSYETENSYVGYRGSNGFSGGGGFSSGGVGVGGGNGSFIGGNLNYENENSKAGYMGNNGFSCGGGDSDDGSGGFSGGGNGGGFSGGGSGGGLRGGGSSSAGGDFSGGGIGGGLSGGSGGDGGGDGGGLFYADLAWRALSPELELPDLFGFDLGTGASDGIPKNSVGYVYNVTSRSNRERLAYGDMDTLKVK